MIYDITPAISPRLAVWPTDTPPTRKVRLDMKRGDWITLSSLRTTCHLGAHADAPSHYGADALAMEAMSLDYYLGSCQVVRVAANRRQCLAPGNVPVPITAERVLFATDTYPDPEHFNEDFASLSPELVESLHRQGVRLVGIDTPSVDPFDSKDLPAHRTFLRCNMAILEGLLLRDVPEGQYELIALPLKLVGFDASPVRAVLRTLPSDSARAR
jgi:arylformamidase